MRASYRLLGPVDMAALRCAVNEIAHRHEALRTTFAEVGGEPQQIIAPRIEIPVAEVDLSSLSGEELERVGTEVVSEETSLPFDLSSGPLLRVTVVRTSRTVCEAIFLVHHIVSDAWSLDNLEYEFFTLYDAFRQELPSPLAPLGIQYADYAIWQRERLQGATLQQEVAYWREHLAEPHLCWTSPLTFLGRPCKECPAADATSALTTKSSTSFTI